MEDKDIKEEVLKEETNKETNEEIKNEEVKDETHEHEHKHGGHTCCGKHGHKHNDEEIGKLKAEIEEWKNSFLRKQADFQNFKARREAPPLGGGGRGGSLRQRSPLRFDASADPLLCEQCGKAAEPL